MNKEREEEIRDTELEIKGVELWSVVKKNKYNRKCSGCGKGIGYDSLIRYIVGIIKGEECVECWVSKNTWYNDKGIKL